MGMGVAGILINSYGSFPHSLLSTSKSKGGNKTEVMWIKVIKDDQTILDSVCGLIEMVFLIFEFV